MQYRPFGRLDWQGSALGFGCARFPVVNKQYEQIDKGTAIEMLHAAIDAGVNYLDTAYNYHGGNSERLVGKALQEGYRDRVKLATKLPCWLVNSIEDCDRLFEEQLERLQVEHIDIYLFHGLRAPRIEIMEKFDLLSKAERAMADGRIGHLGFSFHDTFETFKTIIDSYDNWTMCQFQYNYMNEDYQAGTKGLLYAASKGLATVIMEPLLGGKLAVPPKAVQELWDSAPVQRTPVEWALQWLWNKPEVSVALSGMSTMQQVIENVESADRSGVNLISEDELALVARARDTYNELCPIPCTACNYCMPCPNGVDIPGNFALFNNGAMYGAWEDARRRYARKEEASRASACIQCRQCEELCPQDIPISEWMPVVDEVLGQGRVYEECQLPG